MVLRLWIWQVNRRTFGLSWLTNPVTAEPLPSGVRSRTRVPLVSRLFALTTVLLMFRLLPALWRSICYLSMLARKVTVVLRLGIVRFMRLTYIKRLAPLTVLPLYEVLLWRLFAWAAWDSDVVR